MKAQHVTVLPPGNVQTTLQNFSPHPLFRLIKSRVRLNTENKKHVRLFPEAAQHHE
jgi:hypothetical protein